MTNTTSQPNAHGPEAAAGCYAARYAECQDLLQRLARQLEEHRKAQAQHPAHWGYLGDLADVCDKLAGLLACLGDRSAVEAKGLEY